MRLDAASGLVLKALQAALAACTVAKADLSLGRR
jgi:hypothetical protein